MFISDLFKDPGELIRTLLAFLLVFFIAFALTRLLASSIVRLYVWVKELLWQRRSDRSGASPQELELGTDIFRALGRLTSKELEECEGMTKDQLIAYLDRKFKHGRGMKSRREGKPER